MPISRRYTPEKDPGEVCRFGLDYSALIPPGVGITSGSLAIFTNTVAPAPADSDWSKGPVAVAGRAIYAMLGGGIAGKDYQLIWTAVDTEGNTWPRTCLCLVSRTS